MVVEQTDDLFAGSGKMEDQKINEKGKPNLKKLENSKARRKVRIKNQKIKPDRVIIALLVLNVLVQLVVGLYVERTCSHSVKSLRVTS